MPATVRTRLSGVWHSLRLPQIAAGSVLTLCARREPYSEGFLGVDSVFVEPGPSHPKRSVETRPADTVLGVGPAGVACGRERRCRDG